jgi:hypothetical protein
MSEERAVASLSALADGNRLRIFRQRGLSGHAGRGDRRPHRHERDQRELCGAALAETSGLCRVGKGASK